MRNYNFLAVCLGVIAVFVMGIILLHLKTVLLPFVVALLLSIIFKPIILYLRQKRFPMAISLFGVLVLFFLVLFLVGWVLFASTQSFLIELPKYQGKVAVIASDIESMFIGFAQRFNIPVAEFQWSDAIRLSSVTSFVTSGFGTFISFLSTTFLILLFMLFILAGSGELAQKVRYAFPPTYADRIAVLVSNVDHQVRQYLVTKTLISLGTGAMTWIILLILGVDFPLVWGFVAFVLNYIPNIGSTIAVLFPFALSILQFDSLLIPLAVMIGLGTIQMSLGNIIEPRIMGFSLNLSPLLIIVSLIFWGWLWGLWGMILAVPLTATIKIGLENMETTRAFSILMSSDLPKEDVSG